MNRRIFVLTLSGIALSHLMLSRVPASHRDQAERGSEIVRSEDEWRRRLTPEQYDILREEGTERPWTSPLNKEKRVGIYACAGCDRPLFSSAMKFDSGTGWPSFYELIDGAVATERDFKMILPRTEYHCARCGGHQGHVFDDGPPPTGLRYCENGVAPKLIPDQV